MRRKIFMLCLVLSLVAWGGAPETVARAVQGAQPGAGLTASDVAWVKGGDLKGAIIIRADTYIDAPLEVVWALVRDPNHYQDFNKALTAHLDMLAVGQPISLDIRMFGDELPPTNSLEMVDLVDDQNHVLSWTRDFGLGQTTERPQLLEREGTGTHFYTALKLPSSFGWLVYVTVGLGIHDAFVRFGEGLRTAAVAHQ